MNITPFVIGSGRAAQALREALKVLEIVNSQISVSDVQQIARGASLKGITKGAENPILLVANPHGLHAQAILDADAEGFALMVVEKPAAVNLEQVKALRAVQTPVAICHGYRQMWGIQKLKKKISAGEFGQIVAIEGRYWSSSAAQVSLLGGKSSSWKNDPALGGKHDALIDLATHWLDAAMFLLGEKPTQKNISLSYVNGETEFRDTHVNLDMKTDSGAKIFGSISKTVHGAPNYFEINVIGAKKYACWKFMRPDIIEEGVGALRAEVSRTAREVYGSGHSPHHGLGWLEGYVEILNQSITALESDEHANTYPTLAQHLDVLECLFS